MKDKILQYINKTNIDNRLEKPFDKYYSDNLGEECKITYFTLKELQELYYNNRELYGNYNAYFFKNIDDFFEKNIQYKTSNKDILFCINSYDERGLYYSIDIFGCEGSLNDLT